MPGELQQRLPRNWVEALSTVEHTVYKRTDFQHYIVVRDKGSTSVCALCSNASEDFGLPLEADVVDSEEVDEAIRTLANASNSAIPSA